jgi:hypothetical protein
MFYNRINALRKKDDLYFISNISLTKDKQILLTLSLYGVN